MEIGNVVQIRDCGDGLLLKKVSRDEWLVLLAENCKHFPCPYSSFALSYFGFYRDFKRRFLVVPEMFMKKKKGDVGSFWWKHDAGGLWHAGW